MSYAVNFAGTTSLIIGISAGYASRMAFKASRELYPKNNNAHNMSDANRVVAGAVNSIPVVLALLAGGALAAVSVASLGIGSTVIIGNIADVIKPSSGNVVGLLAGISIALASGSYFLKEARKV